MRSRAFRVARVKAGILAELSVRRTFTWTAIATRRLAAGCLLAAMLAAGSTIIAAQTAEPVKGEVQPTLDNGYARLLFRLSREVESDVKVSNNILIVTFKEPVDIAVDKIAASASGYVTAARLDPDRKGVRLALAQKVTAHAMAAGEKLFVDLLPRNWTGLPPGLPQDVVEELARRAREAEKSLRQRRALMEQQKAPPVRVRASAQPTFTRYVFELPELTAVTMDRSPDKLTLAFDAKLSFDLADAKSVSPPVVTGLQSETDKDMVLVQFTFSDKVDVRSFREDNNYIVDIARPEAREAKREGTVKTDDLAQLAIAAHEQSKAPAGVQPPETVPAATNPAASEPQRAAAAKPPADKPAPAAAKPEAEPAKAAPAPVPAPAAASEMPKIEPPKTEAARAETPKAGPPAIAAPAMTAPATAPAVASPASKPARTAEMPATALPMMDNAPAPTDPNALVSVVTQREGDTVRMAFRFAEPTPAAVFRRADSLWLVFDTRSPMTVSALNEERLPTVRSATVGRIRDVAVVQVKLERPRLVSVQNEGNAWQITLADKMEPTQPLTLNRNLGTRATVSVPFERPGRVHRLSDVDVGDTLLVVTAPGPARGFAKPQDFVEFRTLPSYHGIVVQPLAEDVTAEAASDRVVISRPSGLIISAALSGRDNKVAQAGVIDTHAWGFDRQANFTERKEMLVAAAAEAPEARRFAARLDLARFYLARDMYPEARAVLNVAVADSPPATEVTGAIMMRGMTGVMLDRPDEALKDLANPELGDQYEAPLWRALADARLGKWAAAREGFRTSGGSVGGLPTELQRIVLRTRVRAAIEVGDFADAASQMNEFEVLGVPAEMQASLGVLSGRIAEGLGRTSDALLAYRDAAETMDRPSAAQARLRELLLRRTLGQLSDKDAIAALESLTTAWRGDETEIEALRLLTHLYIQESRHRDAFQMMRVALSAHRNSEVTRRIHDEAIETFDTLFLAGKGDALPAIDALALFYDFRELTPVGRRGDEMIRRLADRLVSVDLLYQASELLQHQVDFRLTGVARAQVAARLAVVQLMDRRPEAALTTLRATRMANLPTELRNHRLLVEARALTDTGRANFALELIEKVEGPQATRLRADMLWVAKRWREAAEQLEKLYGDRWKQFEPLTETERPDILRAAIGYALGEDAIGLERFRVRYNSKFQEGPDRRAFEVVTEPLGMGGTEFRDIARDVSSINTLDAFLGDLRARGSNGGAPETQPARATSQP